ncbi:hypothetical protein Y032_0314g2212 [Ancylostoma ceylanicum]|nr:hypothetical protein Y032_0314g2212 [Ancylostoma ceylanicum]
MSIFGTVLLLVNQRNFCTDSDIRIRTKIKLNFHLRFHAGAGSKTFCPGPLDESRVCNLGECPQWGVWTSWSTCTRTCNTGEMLRTRECENGEGCEGASEERLLCNQHVNNTSYQ